MNTITKFAGAVAVAGAAALATVAPAHADADTVNELAYISTLDEQGIYYSSEDAAINVGYAVCNGLDAGMPVTSVINTGLRATRGMYSPYEVGFITGAAIAAFCPEYLPAATGRHA